jgi:CDP-diacylglycerol--glycerol-3-phosphate 3-phosphatidyltransferase
MECTESAVMPSVYDIKPAFQKLLRPLCRCFASLGITANTVTLTAVAVSLIAGGFIALWPVARWPLFLLPVVLLLRMALNAIDGMLAREHHMKTKLGAVLNELGDVVADSGLYLPFAMIPGVSGPLVVIVVVLAGMSEMTGVVAVQIGASRRYDGPMGKSDRALVFGILSLALALGRGDGRWQWEPGLWANGILAAVVVMLVLTVYNRARGAIKETAAHD